MDLKIQQIRFSKDFFSNFESCVNWLEKEGMSNGKYSEFEKFFVFDFIVPDKFNESSLQTFELAIGVQAIAGILDEKEEQTIDGIQDTEIVKPEQPNLNPEQLAQELQTVKEANSRLADTFKDVLSKLSEAVDIMKPVSAIQKDNNGDEFNLFVPIIKTKEERIIFGQVLVPNETDGQAQIYSEKEVEKAAHYWMKEFQVMGEMHKQMLEETQIQILESYIAPVAFTINGTKVKKGTWLLKSYVVDDELWEKVKNGEYNGYSIGGVANVTDLEEKEEGDA